MAVNCFEKFQTEQDNENWTFHIFLSLQVGRVMQYFLNKFSEIRCLNP